MFESSPAKFVGMILIQIKGCEKVLQYIPQR